MIGIDGMFDPNLFDKTQTMSQSQTLHVRKCFFPSFGLNSCMVKVGTANIPAVRSVFLSPVGVQLLQPAQTELRKTDGFQVQLGYIPVKLTKKNISFIKMTYPPGD